MQDTEQDRPEGLKWAMPVSVAAHLVAVALLVFGLPQPFSTPPEAQIVSVELVPPPEPPEKPKPLAPIPPPALPQAPKPAASAQPKPEAAPAPDPALARAPVPVMRPVFQFGDRDAGPERSLAGNSAQPDPKPAAEPAEPEAATPMLRSGIKQAGESQASMVDEPEAPEPGPAEPSSKTAKASPLVRAKKLFSASMTDDPVATTAMARIPRDRRGGMLCGTELREQLINASPPNFPELLPSVRLTSGTVIEVDAAFQADGAWRSVSYRCEVDDKATKVVAFALKVGALIPRSDWQRLGLPSQ